MSEKAKGKMKEAAGAMTGDEGKKAEGQAQQRKASAREEREQQKRTKAEQNKADRAEKSRDKQERRNNGGLLGNLLSSPQTNESGRGPYRGSGASSALASRPEIDRVHGDPVDALVGAGGGAYSDFPNLLGQ